MDVGEERDTRIDRAHRKAVSSGASDRSERAGFRAIVVSSSAVIFDHTHDAGMGADIWWSCASCSDVHGAVGTSPERSLGVCVVVGEFGEGSCE